MITVHHLENSRSQRVLWLLEELGVDYEIRHYRRDRETMLAPPELKAVHPLGKSPVISDGEQVVAESGAIIEYLCERYDKGALLPAAGTPERMRCTYWLHYAEGSLMPLLVMKLVFSRIAPGAPALVRPIARGIADSVSRRFLDPQLALHLNYIESQLQQTPWLAGDALSVADIQMSFPLEAAALRSAGTRPRTADLLQRIHARPAYQRALERGGPLELLR
jgi:glutathione S-transferase